VGPGQGAEHRRALPAARIQAQVPRRRSRRARGGLHQRRRPGQEGIELASRRRAAGPRRLAHRGARPPGPRGRGHGRHGDPP
jgi:hypothetical protein